MRKITLNIDGMSCGMCESHINDVIRNSFEVKKLKSNHKTGLCEFVTDSSIGLKDLEAVINPTGYKVVGFMEEPYRKSGLFSFFN